MDKKCPLNCGVCDSSNFTECEVYIEEKKTHDWEVMERIINGW